MTQSGGARGPVGHAGSPAPTASVARPRVAAGVLICGPAGGVLLVRPTYKDGWDVPGGYVEPGETPVEACVREVAEELGVRRRPGRLLVADWAPHPVEGDKLLLVFDGGVATQEAVEAMRPDGEEVAAVRLWPEAALADVTPDRLARRLHLALAAVRDGRTRYAEQGEETGGHPPLPPRTP